MRGRLARLAARGIFLGTSSWKYAGWRRLLYDEQRYIYRGKFSESRFERFALAEFAETFRTVCVDAAYYKFPDPNWIAQLTAQVNPGFKFTFKVTDQITIKNFSALPRHGRRAAQPNPHFLNADLFNAAFIAPLTPHRDFVGLIIFEFSHFHATDFKSGREFVAALDQFLARLPTGWRYGVEVRNRNFLHPDYFAMLATHGVAHIFNSWTEMPPLNEQVALPGALTSRAFAGARLLLKPGRSYETAVKLFAPYHEIKEPCDSARAGAQELVKLILRVGLANLFVYVNNRLEGNSLMTITTVLENLLADAEIAAQLPPAQ